MYSVYIGYDPRQPVAYNICQYSVVKNASKPVSITPLILGQLPIKRRGLTEFTYSRYLVPYLCDFKGKALFMDPDMIVTGDICELIDMADPIHGAVHMMKHQPRFEWPSVMLFNNQKCRKLTPEHIDDEANQLYDLAWADNVADIPDEWNYAVGYSQCDAPKLWHYTMGIPCWPETCKIEPDAWNDLFNEANSTVPWRELMGGSVHAEKLKGMNGVNN
jgi:hypothetical protein